VTSIGVLLSEVRGCTLCARHLPLGPRPVLQLHPGARLLEQLRKLRLTLIIGRYAQAYHLPHPSPRNNLWLQRNPWFERELLPRLRERVAAVLDGAAS
jgi:uracil-DNA glycosylase